MIRMFRTIVRHHLSVNHVVEYSGISPVYININEMFTHPGAEFGKDTRKITKLEKYVQHLGEEFLYPSNLERHIPAHDGLASFVCEECGCIFRHLGNLNRHIRVNHTSHRGERTKLLCDECGKAFRDAYDLNRHMHCHSTEKNCFFSK
ncbi:hypothetical protein CSKR_114468, partial [Clonorchis sinensis]